MSETLFEQLCKHREGDPTAYGRLIESLRQMIEGWRRYAPASASQGASDIGQDTITKVYERLESFSGTCTGELIRWVRRIHKNLCADAGRRRQRQVERLGQQQPLDAVPSSRLSTGNAPEQANLDSLPGRVTAALGTLPDDDRELLRLHIEDGLPYEEIGPLFGCTPAAARKRAQRCREALRASLAPPKRGGKL